MPPRKRRLARSAIIKALTRLDELCAASNSRIEIAIYGGTVMMLAYKTLAGREVASGGDR